MCDSWPPAVHIQIIILPLLPARAGAGQLELGAGVTVITLSKWSCGDPGQLSTIYCPWSAPLLNSQ